MSARSRDVPGSLPPLRRRRGALLLEALLALAVFLGAAAFAIGAMRQAFDASHQHVAASQGAAAAQAWMADQTKALEGAQSRKLKAVLLMSLPAIVLLLLLAIGSLFWSPW